MFIWIIMPAFVTTMASLSSDIVKGFCVPWGAYGEQVLGKTINVLMVCVSYVVPMIWTLFCYVRVVYTLKRKVHTLDSMFISLHSMIISCCYLYVSHTIQGYIHTYFNVQHMHSFVDIDFSRNLIFIIPFKHFC